MNRDQLPLPQAGVQGQRKGGSVTIEGGATPLLEEDSLATSSTEIDILQKHSSPTLNSKTELLL